MWVWQYVSRPVLILCEQQILQTIGYILNNSWLQMMHAYKLCDCLQFVHWALKPNVTISKVWCHLWHCTPHDPRLVGFLKKHRLMIDLMIDDWMSYCYRDAAELHRSTEILCSEYDANKTKKNLQIKWLLKGEKKKCLQSIRDVCQNLSAYHSKEKMSTEYKQTPIHSEEEELFVKDLSIISSCVETHCNNLEY